MASAGTWTSFNNIKDRCKEPIEEGGETFPSENFVDIVTNDMINDASNSNGMINMLGDDGDSDGATALLSLPDMANKKTNNFQ